MDDDMELRPTKSGYSGISQSSGTIYGLSKNMIIGIVLCISGGLAIGLGVGLGVGLKNEVVVYVTTKPPAETEPPIFTVKPTTAPAGTEAAEETTTVDVPTVATTTTVGPSDGTPPPGVDGPWLNYRLSGDIVPSHYKLTLQPNMTTNIYTGVNEMTLSVVEDTEYIVLHAHATLMIDSVKLQWINGSILVNWDVTSTFRYSENEFYIIQVGTMMPKGEQFVLTMEFNNRLDKAIVGIYKSTYIDPIDKIEKGIVGSDMEPTDTRRAYPCFDEPTMKIMYTTIIIHEQRHTALSNMPVAMTEDLGNGLNKTTFETSVPMSTYLGCFVVSEFTYKEAISARGIPLRIYGSQYQIDEGQVDLALQATVAMFDKYEALFGVNYTLPKYDQIAIPNFGTGAMENWGLVTYRESNLLWDPNESSTTNKQRVTAVIAHEMVHQWFGNIVTMAWWENTWLNEGFASYFEYRGLKWAQEEWIVEGHHVIGDLQGAMRVDSRAGSHPLKANVSEPSQISAVFDTITYSKGSSFLKMMNDILGEELFIGGLNQYLNDFEFGNTDEQDLWNSVQKYVDANGGGFNVKEIMDPWVQQLGFPVLRVDTSTGNEAVVTQEIMLADASATVTELEESDYDYKWDVLVDYFSDNNLTSEMMFNRSDASITFNITDFGLWLKFNKLERGFYRVNYDDAMWDVLATQLQADVSVIGQIDRSHILDDAFNLAPAQKIDYTTALNMTRYLDLEESYFVWYAFSYGSSYIRTMLASTEQYENFKTYYLSRVKPIADKLGWDVVDGTHEDKLNRPTVLGLALRYDDSEALANATALFSDWRNGTTIHPDIRQLVYRYGILNGDEDDWNYLLERYIAETVATERTNLLRGLAATEDVALIDRLLEYSKNTSVIRDQDFFTCINYISYSVNGNQMAWSWVRVNWDYMVDRFTVQDRNLGNMIANIVEDYNTELQKWEVESFFEATEAGAGAARRKSALQQIDLNIAWLAENEVPIGTWLQDRVNELL